MSRCMRCNQPTQGSKALCADCAPGSSSDAVPSEPNTRLLEGKPQPQRSAKETAVDEALKRIDGFQKFLVRGEIKELPSILWEGELPEKIVTGYYQRGSGVLVATNRRLIFIDKGIVSFRTADFTYDKITTIESQTGIILGSITIYASGNKEEIKQIPKEQTRPFADFLRNKISQPPQSVERPLPSVEQPTTTPISVADELEKLAGLRDRGLLTADEFNSQKAVLLGGN